MTKYRMPFMFVIGSHRRETIFRLEEPETFYEQCKFPECGKMDGIERSLGRESLYNNRICLQIQINNNACACEFKHVRAQK